MYNESSNSDVCFLTLARPADTLTALVSSIVPRHRADITQCRSVYDLIAALQEIPQEQSAILITRPSMLAQPHLITALHQYPNLRLIGWLGADEKLSDPAVSSLSGQGMVMVSRSRTASRCHRRACETPLSASRLPATSKSPNRTPKSNRPTIASAMRNSTRC